MFLTPVQIFRKVFSKQSDSNIKINDEICENEYKEKIKELLLIFENQSNKKDLNVIQQIYNEAYKNQFIDEGQKRFVKSIKSNTELYNYYSIRQIKEKHKLLKLCNKYREVRGDGNCFYTALGFRFLQILLSEQNYQQFIEFLGKIELIDLPFNLNCKNVKIAREIQKSLRSEFLLRLCKIRLIETKEERLKSLQKQYKSNECSDDIDGYFFGLTTIFFRNVSYHVGQKSELAAHIYDMENLLIWGEECNNNEIIIKELSQFLRVMIVLVFIDKGNVKSDEYSSELHYHQIFLLFQPGHYNIGIE